MNFKLSRKNNKLFRKKHLKEGLQKSNMNLKVVSKTKESNRSLFKKNTAGWKINHHYHAQYHLNNNYKLKM